MTLELRFHAIDEPEPGLKWLTHARAVLPSYSAWFLAEGDAARPSYMRCRRELAAHMPELVPLWERLTRLGGDSDQLARLLSLYRPTPYLVACSQAIWRGDAPMLVRNYDYHPARCEGLILSSRWGDTRVIASIDCLWGALDGMNEHGLAVSLAFGGRKTVGDGFGIPLVLRYVLEQCRDTAQAVAVLARVPSHMAYSVAVVDAAGHAATVHVGPDQPAVVDAGAVSTNHQREVAWPAHAALTCSVERQAFLEARLADPGETRAAFCDRFLAPPLYTTRHAQAFGTLYTAIYHPAARTIEYRWPNRVWHQGFDTFVEGAALVRYPG
ncbi:MAG: C45 family peptidase [Kofleriaceae bacterium]